MQAIIDAVNCIFANRESKFIIDPKFSPYISSEDFITGYDLIERFDDKFVEPKFAPNNWKCKIARASIYLLFWSPLSEYTITANHEVFGHGYRIRDIGRKYAKVKKYRVYAPFPYAYGGGYTMYNYNNNLTTSLQSAISIAGTESSSVFANRLILSWLANGKKLDGREFSLYTNSRHDLTNYILMTTSKDSDGHDISTYIKMLNLTYPSDTLHRDDLKLAATVNLLDPFTFYSYSIDSL